MTALVARRAASALIVALCVATFGFLALRLAPGGPFATERRVAPAVARNVERAYHLDQPVWRQYARYLAGLARGDLGRSLRRDVTVGQVVAAGLPVSLGLAAAALALAVGGGLALGVVAARGRRRWPDHLATGVALLGSSLPAFVLGPLLVLGLSLHLGWLPAARWDEPSSIVLPAVTLALVTLGAMARLVRAGLLEALAADHVRTARAKGLAEGAVVLRHGLRSGLGPLVSFLGPAAAHLVTGSFVVEVLFQLPGLGLAFVRAVGDRDYPVVTGLMIFTCLVLVVFNLLVDLAHLALDPRIREDA